MARFSFDPLHPDVATFMNLKDQATESVGSDCLSNRLETQERNQVDLFPILALIQDTFNAGCLSH